MYRPCRSVCPCYCLAAQTLKTANQSFANNILNYTVPDTEDNANNKAIKQYLKDGKLDSHRIKAVLQPLLRFRLLLQLSSSLGIDVPDITSSSERAPYTETPRDRFKPILNDLSKWYEPARKVQKALPSFRQSYDKFRIWKTDPLSSGDVSDPSNLREFVSSITTLVRGIMDSKTALLHQVQSNVHVLAFMVQWHMTVSAK